MSIYSLEAVLRYAYSNDYNCTQWAAPARQCLQQLDQDLTQELCDLLLKHFFSTARTPSILIDTYLTYALLGDSPTVTTSIPQTNSMDDTKTLVDGKLFLARLVNRDIRFATRREYSYQWSCILRFLPSLLKEVDADCKENNSWGPILIKLLVLLSHIVSVGLYPQRKSTRQRVGHQYGNSYMFGSDNDNDSDNDDNDNYRENQQTQGEDFTSSQLLNLSYTNNNTQLALDSQMTLDPDSTFDLDATQPDPSNDKNDLKLAKDGACSGEDNSISGGIMTTSEAVMGDPLAGPSSLQQQESIPTDQQQQHPSQTSSSHPSTWNGSTITTSSHLDSNSFEWGNALSAAKIIIDLIEKKGAKRIIEKYEEEEQKKGNMDLKLDMGDPWVTCHQILVPDDQTPQLNKPSISLASPSIKTTASTTNTNNTYIQKLLLLIERLTDRESEQRLAVHMKYHELEDEGTARAMPSAGLIGLVYYMVQIRPTLNDDELVDRLLKLQAIKGSFDESFYLELWFAALTGLREASLSKSCQNQLSSNSNDKSNLKHDGDRTCNTTVATNRLLWKNLVLVKLPHLIHRLQERKEKQELADYNSRQRSHRKERQIPRDSDVIESSLLELKTFTGLLNACSSSTCCSQFYVPSSKSSRIVDQFSLNKDDTGQHKLSSTTFGDDDDDDMMHMINNTRYTTSTDINDSVFIKLIQSISTEDIFSSIVHSCQSYNLLTDNKVDSILNGTNRNMSPQDNHDLTFKLERGDDNYGDALFQNIGPKLKKQYSSFSIMDVDDDNDMIEPNDLDRDSDNDEKSDPLTQVDENIQQRMIAIRSNITKAALSDLIHIGLLSLIHWRRIVDFLLEVLNESVQDGNLRGVFCLCAALSDCPSAIDLVVQLYPPAILLGPLETVCNEWNPPENYMDVDDGACGNNVDTEDDGDDDMDGIQSWYFRFGKIWTFIHLVTSKFEATCIVNNIFRNKDGLCYRFFVTGPVIYGVDAHDQEIEQVVGRWLSAMGGNGISDDLLRTTKLQVLLQAVPTIIDRLLFIYEVGRMELETLTGVLSYFRRRFLHFTLVPGVTRILCDKLLDGNGSTALECMSHLFLNQSLDDSFVKLCGNQVLGTLRAWMERRKQYTRIHGTSDNYSTSYKQQQQFTTKEEEDNSNQLVKTLESFFITKLDVDNEQYLISPETISSETTRRTLFDKSKEMFRRIVKSGRSMYMNDANGDTNAIWEPMADSKSSNQVVSHFLDLVLFKSALAFGGLHWFIGMIVDEVLEAGKSGGAVRAAELGSCLVTTPLMSSTHGNNPCLSILQCLLQDVIPSYVNNCYKQSASFFQGQTLGVFVSDCLVLMYHEKDDAVDKLGCSFFNALVIDQVRGGDLSSQQCDPLTGKEGSKFSQWNDSVVGSPVWRGFVKGLVSNPFIKQMWPDAYAS
ncbi:hypothetical protein BC941DRAFT_503214 [Chlamydoabsidia padenii]|nr:hypothetical protein BC941DRAFT_503214 [Chlamydoabsidia padenii]